MAIAKTVKEHLHAYQVEYDLITHPHTGSSMETAESAHVPGDSLAKGIVLADGDTYLVVVIPSDYHVELDRLNLLLKRDLYLVDENSLLQLFPDCEQGAVPPLGQAYNVKTVWDPSSSLGSVDEVFFEAGDHRELVCVSGESFHELMAMAERMEFSHHI
ncbi:MAG: YbaK/EbsC family protein [Gammaproteobacteria bacterium]|nr:YbaK/EbsC family protein [Gammaproteobacteria bacterium]